MKRSLSNIGFSDEPALWVTLIMAAVALVASFGVPVTPEQRDAIQHFAEAGAGVLIIGGLVIRQNVTPTAKADRRVQVAKVVAEAKAVTPEFTDARYVQRTELEAMRAELAKLATKASVVDAMRGHERKYHAPVEAPPARTRRAAAVAQR